MPDLSALKDQLQQQVRKPATLSLEVVFDTQSGDVFNAMRIAEELVTDAKRGSASVRAILQYDGKNYEVS